MVLAVVVLAAAFARPTAAGEVPDQADESGLPPQQAPAPAEVPPAPEVQQEVQEEIVVFGELEVARRRALVARDLRGLGYRAGRREQDRTVYRPAEPWRPTVVVHDEGFVVVKRSPVRFEPWLRGRSKLRYLSC